MWIICIYNILLRLLLWHLIINSYCFKFQFPNSPMIHNDNNAYVHCLFSWWYAVVCLTVLGLVFIWSTLLCLVCSLLLYLQITSLVSLHLSSIIFISLMSNVFFTVKNTHLKNRHLYAEFYWGALKSKQHIGMFAAVFMLLFWEFSVSCLGIRGQYTLSGRVGDRGWS